eukprot:2083940-Alexandrium_andersonii.AAC.1
MPRGRIDHVASARNDPGWVSAISGEVAALPLHLAEVHRLCVPPCLHVLFRSKPRQCARAVQQGSNVHDRSQDWLSQAKAERGLGGRALR